MGRRALRKIDPSIDLTGHLRTVEQLPHPWEAATLFGRLRRWRWKSDPARGFSQNAAADRPETDFLGIEIAQKYAQVSAAKLAQAGLRNAMVVCGDAVRMFQELLPGDSLAAVHVYFPDPWWKKRHRRRRVMRESFVRDVERTLRPGGSLHFWTDVAEYFETTLELLAAVTSFGSPWTPPETPAEHDMAYRTHFERRVRQAAEAVYRAEFRKR